MTPDTKPHAADASADSMSTKSARKMEALVPPARRGARRLHRTRVYKEGIARSFFMPKTSRQDGCQLKAETHAVKYASDVTASLIRLRA